MTCIKVTKGAFLAVVTLPSPPQSLTVSGTMQYAITLAWSSPKENADTVTGYRVFYKKYNDAAHYNSVCFLSLDTKWQF